MKTILVFDKPNYCYDCPCYYEDKDKCEVFNKRAIADIGIPSWCPLKQMPSKKETDIETDLSSGDDYISGYKDGYNRGVDVGWNRCLDEILGETECTTQKKDTSM